MLWVRLVFTQLVFGQGFFSEYFSDHTDFSIPSDVFSALQAWENRIRRKDFTPTQYSTVCVNHFLPEDYVQYPTKKILKTGAIPSQFAWKPKTDRRRIIQRIADDESDTDTASEFDEDGDGRREASTQTTNSTFGILYLQNHRDTSLIQFYTGLKDSETFNKVLLHILPGKNRELMLHYHSRRKGKTITGEHLFDSDISDTDCILDSESFTQPGNCKLSVEDEFLLVMMKLRVGLFYKDLATRFDISIGCVQRIFYSWIQFMYLRLGSLKCFPHRNIIVDAMTADFKKEYPTTVLIIDCTEIKLETPSSLQHQSRTFSNYKSTNTLKCLLGVDTRGAIMFVSHLFTGCISDKELCQRSGLFNLLSHKIAKRELLTGDAVMADKGFLITEELDRMGMKLNQPPFLGKRRRLDESEVITTQTIASHRAHVERAIRKIRQFHFFDRRVPISMLHMINQIWLVCCMLTNFQAAIL